MPLSVTLLHDFCGKEKKNDSEQANKEQAAIYSPSMGVIFELPRCQTVAQQRTHKRNRIADGEAGCWLHDATCL